MNNDLIPEKILYFDGERIIFESEEKYYEGVLAIGPEHSTSGVDYIEILSSEVKFKGPIKC